MSAPAAAPARRDTLLAQMIATIGGEVANRVAQLLTVALAGWILGLAGLGVIGLAWSLTAIAQALVQGGPELAGIRRLVMADGDAQATADVIAEITRLKLLLAAAAVPVLAAVQLLLGHDDAAAMVQLAAQTGSMAAAAWGYVWVFRGLHRSHEQGLIRVLQAVGTLVVLVLLLQVWPSPLAVPAAETIAALVAVAVAKRRLGVLRRALHARSGLRDLIGPSLKLGVAGVASTLAWLAPILAAARWASIEDVSCLTGILRLVLGFNGILQIALQAVYPSLAHVYAADPVRGGDASLALVVQAGAATAAGVLVLVGGADILVLAALGPDFTAAVPVLRSLLPVLVPVALGSPLGYALIANGEATRFTRLAVATAAAMTLACAVAFWLAPTAWSVLVVHPVIWGQAAATAAVAWRRGLIGWPTAGWAVLTSPWTLGRMVRKEGGGVR